MIDPVIFSIKITDTFTLTLTWYGVLVMTGVVVAGWLAEKEVRRRGEDGEHIWEVLIWALPAGVIGARLWYVAQSIWSGSRYFLDNPLDIIIPAGGLRGLHFFGALLFGAIALILYVRKYKLDPWLLLDSVAPMALIGQAVARPANFINQELYGQPTTLPWGIPIEAAHRLVPYNDLLVYPLGTTRFHPTFAYEMLWNFLAAALLIWLARRLADTLKPGTIFAGWLILAGIGRVIIESFRFDQPFLPGTALSYSRLFAALMALGGALLLLVITNTIRLPRLTPWREEYYFAPPRPKETPKPKSKRTTRRPRKDELPDEAEEQ